MEYAPLYERYMITLDRGMNSRTALIRTAYEALRRCDYAAAVAYAAVAQAENQIDGHIAIQTERA